MTDRPHRWTSVIVHAMREDAAATLAACEDDAQRLTVALLAELIEVRGPMCADCRVSWSDVYHRPDLPWPCPGERPDALGGPLIPPVRSSTRQERRLARRKALDATTPVDPSVALARMAARRAADNARFIRRNDDAVDTVR